MKISFIVLALILSSFLFGCINQQPQNQQISAEQQNMMDALENLRGEVFTGYNKQVDDRLDNWLLVDFDNDGKPDNKIVASPELSWEEEIKDFGKNYFAPTAFCTSVANITSALAEMVKVPDEFRNKTKAGNPQKTMELCVKMMDEENIIVPIDALCGPQNPQKCAQGFYIELDGAKINENESLEAAAISIENVSTGKTLTEPLFTKNRIKIIFSNSLLQEIALKKQ